MADILICRGKHINQIAGEGRYLEMAQEWAEKAEAKLKEMLTRAETAETKLKEALAEVSHERCEVGTLEGGNWCIRGKNKEAKRSRHN